MWTTRECIRQFEQLMPSAVTKRKGQDVQVIRQIQLFGKHSKYETAPLERALKRAFGSKAELFTKSRAGNQPKTAVVAASSSGSTAWVLANYDTRAMADTGPKYARFRPARPTDELYTWEV